MALTLAHAAYGAGRPVLVLHGLFGSGTNWTAVARRLGEQFRVFTLDLRNHGTSPWAPGMDYRAMAEDVADFIAAQGIGRGALLGHSMGGKVAMVLALSAPQLVERLVVVDIAPVPRPPVHAVELEAMRGLDLGRLSRRSEADAAMRPHIADAAVRAFLLQNLVTGPSGLHWRLNLDAIAQEMAEIAGFPDFPKDVAYNGPTLVVRGERSDYVVDADLPAFARLFPAFRLVSVAGAGHWVHAERSEDFLAVVTPFLAAS